MLNVERNAALYLVTRATELNLILVAFTVPRLCPYPTTGQSFYYYLLYIYILNIKNTRKQIKNGP